MADTQAFEAWWDGRGLPDNLKAAFFMVWQAALASRPAEVDDEGQRSNSPEIEGVGEPSGNSGELASKQVLENIEQLDGWKLVPVELTEDMLIAFAEAWYSKKRCIDDCEMADCYAAMLAAAPDHFTDVGNMVSDNARMSFIEKNAVRGSTYKGITSANIVVWEIEWRELGLRRAIDAAISRPSHTTNKEK